MSKLIALTLAVVGSLLILTVGTGTASAVSGGYTLQLGQGAWVGQVGLADSFAHANQALASSPVQADGVYTVADVGGVQGLPTSALNGLAFSVGNNLPGGIEPCWLVSYVDPSGGAHELHLMAGNSDQSRASNGGTSQSGLGYTRYTFPVTLPSGTVTDLSADVHVRAPLASPTQVLFDNVTIGDQNFTFAGDAQN